MNLKYNLGGVALCVFWYGFQLVNGTISKLDTVGTFEGIWKGIDYYEQADLSLDPLKLVNNDEISLSTIKIDVSTGEQYIIDENEVETVSSDSDSSNQDQSGYMPSSLNNDDDLRRRLAILGIDTRVEEDGNPPTDGIGQWTVCIDFDECAVEALACCCTGYMIEFTWVMTAGHCIHEGGTQNSGWYSNVRVWPRKTRYYTPNVIYARYISVWTEWFNDGNALYDQGFIQLQSDANVGHAGWGWNNGISVGWQFSHFGYSQTLLDNSANFDGVMYQTTGDLSFVDTLYLATDTTDTLGGNSGGPWYYTSNNIIYASHWGTNFVNNFHIRITQGRFDEICKFLNHRCGLFYCAPRCQSLTSQFGCAGDECYENCRNCEIGGSNNNCLCHNSGCNQCDSGYFKIDYDFPCQSCQDSFDHCLHCTDFYGCQQCESGYTLVTDDTGCGDDSATGNGESVKIHYCV